MLRLVMVQVVVLDYMVKIRRVVAVIVMQEVVKVLVLRIMVQEVIEEITVIHTLLQRVYQE